MSVARIAGNFGGGAGGSAGERLSTQPRHTAAQQRQHTAASAERKQSVAKPSTATRRTYKDASSTARQLDERATVEAESGRGCCAKKDASLVYEPCKAGLSWQAAMINNGACLRLHGKRAFASEQLTESIASASEVAHLEDVAPRLVSGGTAVNISVWRRSCLILLVVSSAITTAFRAIDLVRELGHVKDLQAKADESSRRLLNGTDPARAAVSFQLSEYYLERPKIVGGPGCNECTPAVAAATGCQRYLFGQCSWPSVEDAQRYCGSWAQCGGFVCQDTRSDCQARGKGKDSDIALTRSGFSLTRTRDWGIGKDTTTNSRAGAQAGVDAWLSASSTASFVCPDRSTDPSCGLGATTWVKTPDYHIESFGNYTRRFGTVVLAKLALQPLWASCVLHGAVLVLALCGFVSLNLALLHWDHYAQSRRLLLLGWLLVFLGPALVSIVPLRMFVDWDAASEALLDYKEMFRQHFNIDAAEAAITTACDAAAGDGSASSDGRGLLTSAIDEVCGTIDDQLPRGLRIHHEFEAEVGCWIFSGTISKTLVDRTYDFAPVHEACDQAREIEASEDDRNALEKVQEACAVYMEVSSAKPGGNAGHLLDQAEGFTDKVLTTVELMLGAAHALRAFKMLLPAALSIGPGLLRGSVKMKTFIPQSSIPGMFITLLPWLYTPLVWTLYNVGFQLVGDPYMLGGLFFLAFGPMVYYVIGVVMKVTLPMTEDEIRKWLCLTSIQGKIVSVLAYLSLAYWALFVEDTSNRVLETMRTMEIADISIATLVGIISSTITSFVLTTLAATDFMIGETAEQRELENVLDGKGGAQTKLKIMRLLVRPTRLKCLGVKCCGCGDRSNDDEAKQEMATLKDVLESRNMVLDEMREALRSPTEKGKKFTGNVTEGRVTDASLRNQAREEQKLSWCSRSYRRIPVGVAATDSTNAQDESNPGSSHSNSRIKLLWAYCRFLPVHFSRAMESAKLLEDITSVAEERHLATVVGLRKGRTANLIVWRRSALVATVTLSVGAVGWAIASLASNYADLSDLRELSLSSSRRLVNGMDATDIVWSYATELGISTAPVIIGGPACKFAPGLAGQCSWPAAEAAKHCSAWAKCGAYVCSTSDENTGLCQARGHSTAGAAVDTTGDGATLETHVKQGVIKEESFKDYSVRVFQVGLARLRIGSAVAAWWAEAIVVGCVVMSLVMSILALCHWDCYHRSSTYVAVAWFLTFMGPCLVSLLPLRLFIDADGLAGAMEDWVVETRLEYSIEAQLIASLELCQSIVDGDYDDEYNQSIERLDGAIEGVCTAVDNFVPKVIDWQYHESISIPCVVDVQIDIDEYHDFRPVHESCARAREAIENDSAAGALSEVKFSCLDYMDLVGSSGNAFEMMDMVDEYVDKATTAGEVIFSFVQAITSFRILVPAAIAVAPAVIRGALKVKIIVPQSSIPGMFICILPWVYCVVGRWKRITMPMSNAVVVNVLRWIEGYHRFLSILAYVALIYGVARTDIGAISSLFEDWDMELFGRWPVLVSIIFSAAAKLILTGLAGFDFIISTIVEQRRCELPQGSIYGIDKMPDDVFKKREQRLDDVFALFPNALLDNERPSVATRP